MITWTEVGVLAGIIAFATTVTGIIADRDPTGTLLVAIIATVAFVALGAALIAVQRKRV